MSVRARLIFTLLIGLISGVSLSMAGRVLAARAPADPAPQARNAPAALPWEDARLLAEVLQRVRDNYVDPVDDHKLLHAAIRGMVESLDDHSTFLDRDEYEDVKVSTSGAYAGIGIEVEPGKQGVDVVRLMPASPAERAGVRTGDVIVAIDGAAVDPADLDAAIARMRGPEGSYIRLAVQRTGSDGTLEFKVERAHVELASVAAEMIAQDVAYLRISSFTDTTARETEQAMDRLAHRQRLKGVIIDLRNNPGGVLDAAVQMADDFLDSGTIVSADGRASDARFRMEAKPGDIANGAPIVLLVNGGSASASEILAAALHDNHRATLIGRRTYGKGSVQTIMPLANGQAVKLTTSRYFTPAGVSINGIGIVPDVVLNGEERPPAEMDASGALPTLATRDSQVALALGTLQSPDGRMLAHRAGSQIQAAE
jgi:carboxyl-terminal processing protease